ncbi:hypothetical protein C8R41DRAFT_846408 [Lentinula lateritia]|uniref:Uncharacterized protein n=1 Tax=Lentinula lateritia TaxID=40482 RepID=A0ABQ8V5V2_9AGAR|nr:hypothetical protein C8R41DRAFT_846408 [Lentinula lateritia]
MHINLAYLLFALWSVAHAAPTLPSEKTNLKHHSARGRPISFPDPATVATVHVKLDPRNPNRLSTPCMDECGLKLKSIFEEWMRNAKLFEIEKKMIKEGKKPTVNDLPDIPLVPLEIVIEPDSVSALESIKFWGTGVKDIPGFVKGCEKKEDLCWGDVYDHRGVAFFWSAPNVSWVNIMNGYGVGVKEHRGKFTAVG